MENIEMLMRIARSRNFAFKATKQQYHRILRDKAIKEVRAAIWAYHNDCTVILKLVA